MKKLLIAAMIVLTQAGGAWAQSVPKKFQGTWVSIADNDDTSAKIGAKTIDFGSGAKKTISKTEPGDEEGRTLFVTTKPPTCEPIPCPNALPVTFVWKLIKVKGRETLMWVNQESPALWMDIMQRAR